MNNRCGSNGPARHKQYSGAEQVYLIGELTICKQCVQHISMHTVIATNAQSCICEGIDIHNGTVNVRPLTLCYIDESMDRSQHSHYKVSTIMNAAHTDEGFFQHQNKICIICILYSFSTRSIPYHHSKNPTFTIQVVSTTL